MARIAGVNIPDNKHVRVSLTYVYGVGNSLAVSICDKLSIAQDAKVMDLSEVEKVINFWLKMSHLQAEAPQRSSMIMILISMVS